MEKIHILCLFFALSIISSANAQDYIIPDSIFEKCFDLAKHIKKFDNKTSGLTNEYRLVMPEGELIAVGNKAIGFSFENIEIKLFWTEENINYKGNTYNKHLLSSYTGKKKEDIINKIIYYINYYHEDMENGLLEGIPSIFAGNNPLSIQLNYIYSMMKRDGSTYYRGDTLITEVKKYGATFSMVELDDFFKIIVDRDSILKMSFIYVWDLTRPIEEGEHALCLDCISSKSSLTLQDLHKFINVYAGREPYYDLSDTEVSKKGSTDGGENKMIV